MLLTRDSSHVVWVSPRYANKEFTGITPDSIKWWSNYAKNMVFKTEEEAREWVFRVMERSDQQPHSSIFGINGPDYNRQFSDALPLYQSGKSWKIGKRIRKKGFTWDDVDVRPNSLEFLETAGYVNPFDNPELGPVTLIPVSKLHKTEIHSETPQGKEKVWLFAQKLKGGDGYFMAVVYGSNGEIIDGHHRYETARLLKQTRVPAQLLTYDD
jgi:hypothetical protein